jgi:Holliday junction resolvasome RuvABC endonuclease subunit
MILALDCATKTGWCLWNTLADRIPINQILESGVQDFSKTRGESNGMLFLKFRNWFDKITAQNQIHVVVYEQAHHRGGAATEICVNLTGRVQELCVLKGIEYTTIHTATLKKFATGAGRADKADMIKASAKLLGRQPVDDNEADAVLMAKWASENY